MDVLHARIQHGVGQGSFHSATVEVVDPYRSRFDYVYDCGARAGSGMSKELKRSIARLGLEQRVGSSDRAVLDVLVLSHYDSDHLNGAKYLSSLLDIRRVFLPYLSPDELILVLASQDEALSAEQITQLYELAHGGGTLWGIPVTMVRGGGEGEDQSPPERDPPRREGTTEKLDGAPQLARLTLRSTMGGGAETLPLTMSHHDDLLAKAFNGRPLWRLRFWNRGVDANLVTEIRNQLGKCGFPLRELNDPAGAPHLVSWLATDKNRKAAVKAYREAINICNPPWAHEAKSGGLANLLSLAMYSGPDFEVAEVHSSRRHRSIPPYWQAHWAYGHDAGKGGWLGTGDAPLGEGAVWSDFVSHYANELSAVSTYLVPHHGAAPSGGPTYYHSGLNHAPGVASVISYGSTNSYGHPRFSVISQILAQRGELYEVTEACEHGFHEVLRLRGS